MTTMTEFLRDADKKLYGHEHTLKMVVPLRMDDVNKTVLTECSDCKCRQWVELPDGGYERLVFCAIEIRKLITRVAT